MKRRIARVVVGAALLAALFGAVMSVLRRLAASVGDEDSDELRLAAIMNGIELHSRAPSFRGGSAKAIMGGILLDLHDARLDPAGARLTLSAAMGGIQLIVPADWRISVSRSRAVMGRISLPEKSDVIESAAPELQLDCTTLLGGIEVKASASEE